MSYPTERIIENFYTAFQQGDADAMAACYHPDVEFEDPAFRKLKGAEVSSMWRMLLERGKGEIEISFYEVEADDNTGAATWEAIYFFSKTKRKVHNIIQASFEFQDGKIIKHTDVFSFWRWSRMALGPIGLLLGWTPFLQNKVSKTSRGLLAVYMKKQGTV